ncbi:MAG: hypothetical protein GC154_20240 [bacterium]|nr:hypothetical protein [bacterium]
MKRLNWNTVGFTASLGLLAGAYLFLAGAARAETADPLEQYSPDEVYMLAYGPGPLHGARPEFGPPPGARRGAPDGDVPPERMRDRRGERPLGPPPWAARGEEMRGRGPRGPMAFADRFDGERPFGPPPWAARGEGFRGRGPREDAPRGEGFRGRGPREDAPRGEGFRGRGPREDAPRGEGFRGRGPREDAPRMSRLNDQEKAQHLKERIHELEKQLDKLTEHASE